MPELDGLYDKFSKPVAIGYIGTKKVKRDTICRTGVVWDGMGDIQVVDPRAAQHFLKYPKVFIPGEKVEAYMKSLEVELKDEVSKTLKDEKDTDSHDEPDTGDTAIDRKIVDSIKLAIMSLDAENSELFGQGGKPKIDSVRNVMPDAEFSAADLTVAWNELNAAG